VKRFFGMAKPSFLRMKFCQKTQDPAGPVSEEVTMGSTVPGRSDGPEAFINDVDRVLYQAKEAGRDRIIASESK
jgi:PleD family two-component response regulator